MSSRYDGNASPVVSQMSIAASASSLAPSVANSDTPQNEPTATTAVHNKKSWKAVQRQMRKELERKKAMEASTTIHNHVRVAVIGNTIFKSVGGSKQEALIFQLIEKECNAKFKNMRLQREQEGIYFMDQVYESTDNINVKVHFWVNFRNDTDTYESPTHADYRQNVLRMTASCHAFYVVYHIEDYGSYETARLWLAELKRFHRQHRLPSNKVFFLIGMKSLHNIAEANNANNSGQSSAQSVDQSGFNLQSQRSLGSMQMRKPLGSHISLPKGMEGLRGVLDAADRAKNALFSEFTQNMQTQADLARKVEIENRFRVVKIEDAISLAHSMGCLYQEIGMHEAYQPLNKIVKETLRKVTGHFSVATKSRLFLSQGSSVEGDHSLPAEKTLSPKSSTLAEPEPKRRPSAVPPPALQAPAPASPPAAPEPDAQSPSPTRRISFWNTNKNRKASIFGDIFNKNVPKVAPAGEVTKPVGTIVITQSRMMQQAALTDVCDWM